jgi:ATP-dependent Clp protease protease subunit
MSTQDNEELDKSHSQLLMDAGMYVFMDAVSAESMKPIIEWILYENHLAKIKKKELLLMVCSGGGDISEAFALIDVMNSSTVPIKTVGLGCIASCGLLIFMAGFKGRRILTPNTSILSHQFSWQTEGKAHELFATVKEFKLTEQRMIEHYRRCTGASDANIRKYLLPSQDVWLSADEAMKLNICDHIGGNYQEFNDKPRANKLPKIPKILKDQPTNSDR